MPYNDIIDRDEAGALASEDASREIFQSAVEQSAVMRLGRRLPNMGNGQRRVRVTNLLPLAYFVDGDTGLKQTTQKTWRNVYINAEEIAVIVPVPENVIDDVDYDIWEETRPSIAEAIGQVWDQAILYGTNAPADWPDDLLTQINAADHAVEIGTGTDLYEDLLGEDGVVAKIEEDGYMANGHVAALNMRAKLRGVRTSEGELIFQQSMQAESRYFLDGEPILFPRNGGVDPASSLLVSGDWSQLVYAVRSDLRFKVLTEAVIQDQAGNIVYNLAQQDMVALRVTFRGGWALPNPSNRIAPDTAQDTALATRLPFAALTPASSS